LGATALGVSLPGAAEATLARAVRLPELVRQSRRVLVVTPLDAYSVWETLDGRRRIVTYTRARYEEHISGDDAREPEILVRTLGGRVNGVGQIVHGEAQLRAEERSIVFLRARPDGVDRVTAMAQGHYPLHADPKGMIRLQTSPFLPELLAADGSAVERLRGAVLSDAVRRIREARGE
jgi:hypothetical protein